MLRIYPVILETIAQLRPVIAELERRDPDLARQLKRASASVALNVAEGSDSQGKIRTARYHTALGSMRETKAAVDVAVAMGYLREVPTDLPGRFDHILGTLVRLTIPRTA